jgi:hypothetical protein
MRTLLLLALCVLLSCAHEESKLSVSIGPTSIPRGDAVGANDITVSNGLFAVAFAVDTAPPWGVARGGIVDISIIRDGKLDYDIASLADFMPNNWSSWPTTYQRVSIEKQTTDEVVVKTERDWGDVELKTLFHIKAADSRIQILTTMTNNGATTLDALLTGYVVWPDGGSLREKAVNISAGDDVTTGGWTAAYDESWALGLHAPFSDVVSQEGRDRYLAHDLAPGETRSFEAWLQIESDGSLAPMVQTEIEFGGLPFGRISGQVAGDDGAVVERPAVVVMKDGAPLFWGMGEEGRYEIDIPSGDFEIYATARAYGQSQSQRVSVSSGSKTTVDFDDVRPPGVVQIQVNDQQSGEPLDARVSIKEGQKPLIGFFGKDVYFTELNRVGEVVQSIAPGRYVFEISAAGGFTSKPQRLEVVVESSETKAKVVQIPVLATPHDEGWYNADMHHHSDVLDGFTEAEFVMRSELAAGVNITFLSDHDSVINNNEMRKLSKTRSVPFIPGTELSPSWAHFNAYPVDDGTSVDIDTGQSSVQEIFAEARRMGADIISVNHPNSEYGYFTSWRNDVVQGGYDDGFDLVEIELSEFGERNRKTLLRVWNMWNEGQKVYLAAGSDAHDVWTEVSGAARSYAYVDGDFSIEKFIAALKAGHSFASQGPLVFPEILFGSEVSQNIGEVLDLRYSVQAVSGLKSVKLIAQGSALEEREMSDEVTRVDVEFSVHPDVDTWYSLVVEDSNGKFAYTNPVWVSITN